MNCFARKELLDLLEFKPAATAIHWRGMEARMANQVAHKVHDVWSMLQWPRWTASC